MAVRAGPRTLRGLPGLSVPLLTGELQLPTVGNISVDAWHAPVPVVDLGMLQLCSD